MPIPTTILAFLLMCIYWSSLQMVWLCQQICFILLLHFCVCTHLSQYSSCWNIHVSWLVSILYAHLVNFFTSNIINICQSPDTICSISLLDTYNSNFWVTSFFSFLWIIAWVKIMKVVHHHLLLFCVPNLLHSLCWQFLNFTHSPSIIVYRCLKKFIFYLSMVWILFTWLAVLQSLP